MAWYCSDLLPFLDGFFFFSGILPLLKATERFGTDRGPKVCKGEEIRSEALLSVSVIVDRLLFA